VKLRSSEEYKRLTPEGKAKICNGCGPASAFIDLVPDTIYGLNISECCNIHDCDYHFGGTLEDKNNADLRLLNNLLILINKGNFWLRWFRRRRALKYYEAVREWGESAFWSGKND